MKGSPPEGLQDRGRAPLLGGLHASMKGSPRKDCKTTRWCGALTWCGRLNEGQPPGRTASFHDRLGGARDCVASMKGSPRKDCKPMPALVIVRQTLPQ